MRWLSYVSAPTGVVACGGLILLCHLVLNLIKLNAASYGNFKNQLENII